MQRNEQLAERLVQTREQLTIYWCEFCGYKFAAFTRFPDDIMPYCVNCSNDEDITELETVEISL